MIDYHAHLSPKQLTLDAVGRRFMPFPVPLPEGLVSLDWHLEQMDRQGLTRRYISVPPIMYGCELPVSDQVAHIHALNDWLIEAVDHERLSRTAVLPLSSPEDALRELERVAVAGVRSVAIGSHVNGVPLDEAIPDELWAALAEKTEFVLLHPWQIRSSSLLEGFGLGNAVGNPMETTVAAARLVASGTMARHPSLQILLSHGGGALPYLLGRINQAWSSSVVDRPSILESARRFLYDIVVFRPEQLRHLVDAIGIDRVVVGTDSPFDMAVDDPAGLIAAAGFKVEEFQGVRIAPVDGTAKGGSGVHETA